ncbi:MAG: hypothetical protein KDA80_17655, partial [Planctomycetaceae bacterium]|nr:hypothetical protein [Planctomycetaceae bacterium]
GLREETSVRVGLDAVEFDCDLASLDQNPFKMTDPSSSKIESPQRRPVRRPRHLRWVIWGLVGLSALILGVCLQPRHGLNPLEQQLIGAWHIEFDTSTRPDLREVIYLFTPDRQLKTWFREPERGWQASRGNGSLWAVQQRQLEVGPWNSGKPLRVRLWESLFQVLNTSDYSLDTRDEIHSVSDKAMVMIHSTQVVPTLSGRIRGAHRKSTSLQVMRWTRIPPEDVSQLVSRPPSGEEPGNSNE